MKTVDTKQLETKSDAESIARLRKMADDAFDGSGFSEQMLSNGPVADLMTDLRALLDAYAALETDNERLRTDLLAGGWTAGKSQLRAMHGELMNENAGLKAALEQLRADSKLWKIGAGGQDKYAGLPPAMRIIDAVLAETGRR